MTNLILFAPGAGAPADSPWMRAWAERLAPLGHVVPFDYPYRKAGRRSPDRPPVLVAAHREALAAARAGHEGPVYLAGKSMGGRIGCHVALEETVDGIICFGYPLVGQNGSVRDEVLKQLRTPILFLQGSRDPLCPLAKLESVLPQMHAPYTLHVVEGGDHSLVVRKTALKQSGRTQEQVDDETLAAVARFVISR
jgi:predicted alpha/beta-hydrolase family hydrolase